MSKLFISLSIAALLGTTSFTAAAAIAPAFDGTVARAERPEKPEKPEKREKVGALESTIQLAREASEGPRGRDNERPGDRQRRGGRG